MNCFFVHIYLSAELTDIASVFYCNFIVNMSENSPKNSLEPVRKQSVTVDITTLKVLFDKYLENPCLSLGSWHSTTELRPQLRS